MDRDKLLALMQAVQEQQVSPEEALERLRHMPYENLGFANIDVHRAARQGMAEVIFCPGKTPGQIAEIATRLLTHHKVVLASRASADVAEQVLQQLPGGTYHELGRMLVFGPLPQPDESLPMVAVVTAGTADLPVAEEAAILLQAAAIPLRRLSDVGVAGIHRLLDNLDVFKDVSVTIVVAGMDGALPSVLAGLLDMPVIAVPTSVGYGANFEGIAPLLTMLNSCAAGLTVVNVDNGFGAATAALRHINALKKHLALMSKHT